MGNYYEGTLTFLLRNDTPVEIINDLYTLSHCCDQWEDYVKENFKILQNTKWFKHKRFNYPQYQFIEHDFDNRRVYELFIQFYMKGYIDGDDDLGQDIYDTLKPYIDTTVYDTSNGVSLGRIHDEDGIYDKTFYADEDMLKQEMKRRKYVCNQACGGYKENCLCDRYAGCRRAYIRGLNDGKKGIVHDGTKLIYKLLDFNKTN